MVGIKKVAGLTRRFCRVDGYGFCVQAIYSPETDAVRGYVQTQGSWVVPSEGEITVFFRTPTSMDSVLETVYEKIEELNTMERFMREVSE